MAKRLYPIGIQTFEEIRRLGMFYVDKTEYVYHMTHTSGKYFFLSRPRRFGKSLLVSTFQSYFEGRKDLFEGLALEKQETEWTEYPVLHFDMSRGKHLDKDALNRYLLDIIEKQERMYGVGSAKPDVNIRFTDLIETVYRKTGKQVVVLIDEYDAPLLDVVHEDTLLPQLRDTMRNFYSPLKAAEPMLRFVFMTGITKFSQLSIFSELNNISNISMDEPYAGICGITKEEMLTQMSDDIDELADKQKLSREETVTRLTDMYDGYHFTWPSPDVFNPFSLLNCLSRQKLSAFWFGTGTPTYLINMMRKFHVQPDALKPMLAKSSAFDAPTESMISLTPLLYQSGYLTIKDYDEYTDLYTLDFPNREIKVGVFESLLPNYMGGDAERCDVAIAQMSALIKRDNIEGGLQLLADFLETVPYCDNTNYEGHWQQTLYIIFALLTDYRIQVEQHTAKGRIDITLETSTTIYVMELKLNGSVEEALAQIDARHYVDAFKMQSKPVVKVGMNFMLKDSVNTLEWRVVGCD